MAVCIMLHEYVVVWIVLVRSQYNIERIGVVIIEPWCL